MLTKFLCYNNPLIFSFNNSHPSKLCRNYRWRCQHIIMRQSHDWKRQMEYNNERRKIITKLVYLHNPWRYFLTKLNLLKFQIFWDHEFVESEFIRGSKQVTFLCIRFTIWLQSRLTAEIDLESLKLIYFHYTSTLAIRFQTTNTQGMGLSCSCCSLSGIKENRLWARGKGKKPLDLMLAFNLCM